MTCFLGFLILGLIHDGDPVSARTVCRLQGEGLLEVTHLAELLLEVRDLVLEMN